MTDKHYENICLKCEKPFWNEYLTTTVPDLCKGHPAPTGWICPNCGAGMNPTVNKCDCKDLLKIT